MLKSSIMFLAMLRKIMDLIFWFNPGKDTLILSGLRGDSFEDEIPAAGSIGWNVTLLIFIPLRLA